MNCPKCNIGVLETVGYFDLDESRFTYSRIPPREIPSFVVSLCSRGCDYVDIRATPDLLYFVRKRMRAANLHALEEAIDQ